MSIFDRIRNLFGGGNGDGAVPAGPGGSGPGGGQEPMISCEQALTFIQEFLDGELEGVTHEKVEAHFDVCGRCYPHLQLEESFRTAVRRAAEGQEAPRELKDRVLHLLSGAADE